MGGPQLTPTEHAILDGIREGRVDAEMAARLGISIAEVKRRVENLMSIAGVEERRSLADGDPGQARVASPPGASPYTGSALGRTTRHSRQRSMYPLRLRRRRRNGDNRSDADPGGRGGRGPASRARRPAARRVRDGGGWRYGRVLSLQQPA
ncbi:MAG: hypothetical protein U5Q44_12630 [Dehalococcoidia bacterium]|nr:hypothetical protein [Dehalococcoidia bacterium]